ncbi:MAG: Mor transcription activator family protein [Romboutsia sp.]
MYEDVRIEDIPEDLIVLVEFLGMDIFIKFCEKFGGNHFYLPNKKSILRCSRNREIRKKYNGINGKELANKYGISEIYLRTIVKDI